uniref:Uncharacterized protein n=1 Tax=Anopheles arabiensis TaxID=7173 RepID=A0A182IHU8_ANOAR
MFEHGVWRRRMNHELADLYGKSSILTVVLGAWEYCERDGWIR